MKAILCIFLAIPILSFGQKFDQYVFAAQGDFSVSPSMSLSWTLGENFIETIDLKDRIYTQGFQQPILKIQEMHKAHLTSFDATIFPNPSDGILNISVKNSEEYYDLEVLDVTGRLLQLSDKNIESSELDLSAYDSGIYFIRITNVEKSRNSLYKIVKL